MDYAKVVSTCTNKSMLTFLLWEMLRAPKSLNSEDVGEFTGSVENHKCKDISCIQCMTTQSCITKYHMSLTMSAVTKVLGTIVEETGRAAAGSHSLKRAQICYSGNSYVSAHCHQTALMIHLNKTFYTKCTNTNYLQDI